MNRLIHLSALLLLLSCSLTAQDDPDFWVGSWGVAPKWDPVYKTNHFIRGLDSLHGTVMDSIYLLPLARLDSAQELGLNLVGCDISSGMGNDHVVPDSNVLDNNAVEEICDRAEFRNQQVCIHDWSLQNMSHGDRLYLHPEASDDFETNDFDTEIESDFTSFILSDSPFTTTLRDRGTNTSNCVKLEPGKNGVRRLKWQRIRELSAYPIQGDPDKSPISGLYQISVIVKPITGIGQPEVDRWNTPLLHVDVWSSIYGSSDSIRHRFSLHGSRLWYVESISSPNDTVWALKDSVQEYVLGRIEIICDSNTIPNPFYAVQGGDDEYWTKNHLPRAGDRKVPQDSSGIYTARGKFDIRLSYGDDDAAVYVDAICLTNPATFGVWHGEHDSTITEHSGNKDALQSRLNHLLNGNTPGGGAFDALRFIYGAEQGVKRGTYWSAFLLDRLITATSGGEVELYFPTGSSDDYRTSGLLGSGSTSGIYCYPLLSSDPRPTLAPDEGVYHQALYSDSYDAMRMYWRHFRKHAETRATYNVTRKWIPFIQNHSNLYEPDPPKWWDNVSNREPSAAELRLSCNTALAFGVNGIMFWAFSSAPWVDSTSAHAFGPADTAYATWSADLDPGLGTLGFIGALGEDEVKRTFDYNGENKWDSTKAYIEDFLTPIGAYIAKNLKWKRNYQPYLNWIAPSEIGSTNHVYKVVSYRQDVDTGRDYGPTTYVMVTEFEDKATHQPYLFVVNGRSHPEGAGGHRHITVKLKPNGDSLQYKVTKIHGENELGDIWIVQPSAKPDTTSTANGFTDYFEPGAAALYRLETVSNPGCGLPDTIPANVFVTIGAKTSLTTSKVYHLYGGKGIYSEGYFSARGCTFSAADETWLGIFARNDGNIVLDDCVVNNASIVAGSSGSAYLYDTQINSAPYALYNLGGTLSSATTTAVNCAYGYAWINGPVSYFSQDAASAAAGAPAWSTGIDMHGWGFTDLYRSTLTDFGTGIHTRSGVVSTDVGNRLLRGWNSIDAVSNVLISDSLGWIDFGDTLDVSGTENCFNLQDNVNGFHAWGGGNGIEAAGSYWESSGPLNLSGTCNVDYRLPTCPIPFAPRSGGNALSKSTTASTSSRARAALLRAFLDSNYTTVRSMVRTQLAGGAQAQLDHRLMHLIRFTLSKRPELSDLRDSLVTAMLLHPSISMKLLAADALADVERFGEALEVLDAYSFAGSTELKRQELLRRALFSPHAYNDGYRRGLRALDTLQTMVAQDSSWLPLFTLYPRVYSNLTRSLNDTSIVKPGEARSLWTRIIPDGIELGQNYPNPFRDITSFTFKLGETQNVRLSVYDAMGREVAVVTDAEYGRGVHSAILQSAHLPSGLYFYRLMTKQGIIQKKMMLVR